MEERAVLYAQAKGNWKLFTLYGTMMMTMIMMMERDAYVLSSTNKRIISKEESSKFERNRIFLN